MSLAVMRVGMLCKLRAGTTIAAARLSATVAALVLVACAEGGPTTPGSAQSPAAVPSPPEITTVDSAVLSGAALQAWGADGRFHSAPTPFDPSFPTLSQTEAEGAIAEYMRTIGPSLSSLLSQSRGEAIRVETLTPCGPAIYGESALSPPPDSLIFNFRVVLGPSWLQAYCEAGVEKVLLSLGAYATPLAGLNFDSSASFTLDALLQAAVHAFGLPVGVRAPIHPEEAASRVAELTGRRVVSVPRLVLPRPPLVQTQALWIVELEQPSAVLGKRTGVTRSRQTLQYGMYDATSEVTVWDTLDPDPGPFSFIGVVKSADGVQREYPMTLGRRPIPSFNYNMEPVVRP